MAATGSRDWEQPAWWREDDGSLWLPCGLAGGLTGFIRWWLWFVDFLFHVVTSTPRQPANQPINLTHHETVIHFGLILLVYPALFLLARDLVRNRSLVWDVARKAWKRFVGALERGHGVAARGPGAVVDELLAFPRILVAAAREAAQEGSPLREAVGRLGAEAAAYPGRLGAALTAFGGVEVASWEQVVNFARAAATDLAAFPHLLTAHLAPARYAAVVDVVRDLFGVASVSSPVPAWEGPTRPAPTQRAREDPFPTMSTPGGPPSSHHMLRPGAASGLKRGAGTRDALRAVRAAGREVP